MAGQGGGGGGLSLATYVAWGVCALLVGLAADVLQPLGPFVAFLLGVFLAVAALCALLSFLPPLRGMMRPATVFALWGVAVFGGIFAAQSYLAPQPAGPQRGFLAAIGPGAPLQRLVLAEAARREPAETALAPPPAAEPAAGAAPVDSLDALRAALGDPDPAKRTRAAVEAMRSTDAGFLTAAIDMVYASREPALRREAIVAILARRQGAGIALLPGAPSDEAGAALAAALQGAVLRITAVTPEAGAFEGSLCSNPGMTGTVNVSGVSLAGRCAVGDTISRVVLDLAPSDDFRLVGTARNELGQSAPVAAPLR